MPDTQNESLPKIRGPLLQENTLEFLILIFIVFFYLF